MGEGRKIDGGESGVSRGYLAAARGMKRLGASGWAGENRRRFDRHAVSRGFVDGVRLP